MRGGTMRSAGRPIPVRHINVTRIGDNTLKARGLKRALARSRHNPAFTTQVGFPEPLSRSRVTQLLRAGKDGIGLPLAGLALPGGDFLENFV
jgi:hypothetical protein